MIRRFLLRVLAFLARLIAKAQVYLGEIEIEVVREGVAIADGVGVAAGHVASVERELANQLVAKGLARRV